jgi:galactonate dehydratase
MDMKITDIRTVRLVGPLLHGVGGVAGQITKVLVRVDTDAGVCGLGEADDFFGVRDAVEFIRSCLIGQNPLDIQPAVSRVLYGNLPPHAHGSQFETNNRPGSYQFDPGYCSPTATPTGPIVWGMSGVEMALCDLSGKAMGVPVYRLLGGAYRDRVRIYLDRSSPEDPSDLDAWKKLVLEVVEGGFGQMKFDIECIASDHTIDVWNRSLTLGQINRIVERITLVRETVGWDLELCADCHMQYNVVDAIQVARALAPFKLAWLEDPTPITNPDACAAVKEASPIPICVGEMFVAEQVKTFIDHQACDIIHPDVMFTGGLHETRKFADYADLAYMPLALHGNGGALATIAAGHVAAASRNFLGLEYHFSETPWLGQYVRRNGVELFDNGYLPLTDAPGLGVELDPHVCQQYLAEGEVLF